MTARRAALTCAWIGALAFLLGGAWALFAPRSFFDVAATYPPYNPHLFHDVGAFQLGIAAGLVAGIFGRSCLAVGLWTGAVGASAHGVAHWVESDLGGRPAHPALLTVGAAGFEAGLLPAEEGRAGRGPQPAGTSGLRQGR